MLPLVQGSYRNHCPDCLWSVHLDLLPGDRQSDCGQPMAPIELAWPRGKGLAVRHRCTGCGQIVLTRLATDDPRQPDRIEVIAALQGRQPPR